MGRVRDHDSTDITGYDIVDQAPVGITKFDTTAEGTPVVYANDRFLEMTGYDESAVLGEDWLALRGPGTDGERVERLRAATEAGEQATAELRNYRADGTSFWNRIRVAPLRDGSGEVTEFMAFHEDVTEKKRHEETLESLHQVATELQTESTVDAVCERTIAVAASLLDFDMCTIITREGDWLVPRATAEGAPPDGSRRMRLDQGLAGETYQTGESHVIHEVSDDDVSDPAKSTYQSGISVPVGDRGVFQAVQTETHAFDERDVELTELLVTHTASAIGRIEREQELQQQNDRLERFADVVSHDLRNPLNVLAGSLKLAAETGDPDHFERSQRALDRMEQLIDDLLSLARHGTPVDDETTVDLAAVVDGCWDTVATPDATIDVRTALSIRCHEGRFKQLLENLFRNSVEHTDTEVTVTVGDLPDSDGFFVADDGTGIPPEDRDRVFESGYSTDRDGTGLGLAIVGDIAATHDWDVEITESDTGGTRFEFRGVDIAD
ncbi:histidine kinase [Halobacteriales archaeon QH_8_67_27]|nr:MAG: histidine kinase [Halobacteriales archaeon QH_8_67_27]